ncbi:DNA-binding protein [Faecalibacillus intestinalis]|uniref:DNA-binding protein n=1 Tax=Faecalibacillus intestinalis TaxID=1982626 RepID=UPI003520869F
MNKEVYTKNDVMMILNCKKTKAYDVIRKLNKELEKEGYFTIAGKVNAKYFRKRKLNEIY